MNIIKWLQDYFEECCNDDWEHTYQIKIETLDNPGWLVDIDIADTNLESYSFEEIRIERDDNNWITCRIENKVFKGRGGVKNLEEILTIFSEWVRPKS
ncbi:MAG: immunity 53 family protein [Proteobacteria bacterium]|nr:immunity 53 family protein [Pseudomonadota bacterium]